RLTHPLQPIAVPCNQTGIPPQPVDPFPVKTWHRTLPPNAGPAREPSEDHETIPVKWAAGGNRLRPAGFRGEEEGRRRPAKRPWPSAQITGPSGPICPSLGPVSLSNHSVNWFVLGCLSPRALSRWPDRRPDDRRIRDRLPQTAYDVSGAASAPASDQ